MKFIIERNRGVGLVELLILLPLFLGVLCIVVGSGFFLIQKMSLEKYAWTRQTQLTYGARPQPRALVEETPSPKLSGFQSQGGLPNAFQRFLLMNPSLHYSLKMKATVSSIFQIFYFASFSSKDSTMKMWKTSFTVPGSTLKNDFVFKNKLWFENMSKAGFDYPLLQQVGLKEIKDAAIPWSRIENILSPEEIKWIENGE